MGALIGLFLICIVLSLLLGGGIWLTVILFVAFAAVIAIAAFMSAKKSSEEQEQQKKIIEKEHIHVDADYSFYGANRIRFIIDDVQKMVLISENSSHFRRIPFSTIIGCEIMVDSEVTGGVGRAVAGGIIAGGVGAIVGVATSKKTIKSYTLTI
ncbi:MAG: hypothetical protein IJ052_05160, partial [Oscillospiraceae bacterium]|nr:hypothetical protein [Oscillospiraceae bacterium]